MNAQALRGLEPHPDRPLRIALWSGPRNISTALLRSFGSRSDCFVTDEPLYAHYLGAHGLDHPGRNEILERHERDWRKVVDWLCGPVPQAKAVWYQKHMAHHLTAEVGREWLAGFAQGFLIRDPREMLVSLAQVTPHPCLEDTGLPQQLELFEQQRQRLGSVPPVIDARDVLEAPRPLLARLCAGLGLAFDERMLAWEAGPRATDGVWAKHWYAAVERSTGFERWQPRKAELSADLAQVERRCRPLYEHLYSLRLKPGDR